MRSASTFREWPRRVLTSAALLLSVAAAALAGAPQEPAPYRASTDLVALQVTVVDAKRRYVPDLTLGDFEVLDEGRRQTVDLFAAGSTPLDLMLLVDTSASMLDCLPTVRAAAANLVRALSPEDRAEIIVFNDSVRIAREMTGDREALVTSLGEMRTRGSTSLYDALYVALKRLARQPASDGPLRRRQAVVVLSDGDDTTSHVSFADVHGEARIGNAMVYAIVPPEVGTRGPMHKLLPSGLYNLRMLADESGGRSFNPQRIADLIGVYAEIADEFRQQYWLAFPPPGSATGFRRVSVRIPGNPTLRARTRAGYVAGPSRASIARPR